jgi:hypothetical protein
MNKKEHLIKSLEVAIDALRNGTIHYDWINQCSCNAGIVSQAVLGLSANELEEVKEPLFKVVNEIYEKDSKVERSWKNAIMYGCPLTGKSIPTIIKDLENAGLSRNDIVHLEYLDNPGILANSDIQTETVEDKTLTGYETHTVPDNSTFMKRWKKATKEVEVPIYVNYVREVYPTNYYRKKENLIKYLFSWVKILKNEIREDIKIKAQLESMLLIAVSEENYERAAQLRNEILSLS